MIVRGSGGRAGRSISTPIILASIAVGLSIALLVGWTLIIVRNLPIEASVWLLVLGICSFVVIMSVLVMFSIFLVREILEARRQYGFIDSVTHELKSPLASLRLCLETLARPELNAEQRAGLHDMMTSDVDRLTVFIDDVLQASRLAHGRRGGVPVGSLVLRDVVAHAAETVARRYHLDAGAITIEVADDIEIVSEITSLETVLKNLLDNAVKYSDSPVEVRVEARVDERERVHIDVIDRGIGIPRDEIKRVFRRFYRVENEQVRRRRGTGLGLFVVQALVRYLGGRLEATSEGVGCGTTMHLVLPLDGFGAEAGRSVDRLRETFREASATLSTSRRPSTPTDEPDSK